VAAPRPTEAAVTVTATDRRARVLVGGAATFVVLTSAAMATYHGGSPLDPSARHYRFFGNFFSDLGSTVTYSGRGNGTARALFVASLACVGVALAWSAPAWRTFAARGRAMPAAWASSVVAALSGVAFFAVGITPWNRDLDLHMLFVQTGFGLLAVFAACLVIVQARNHASLACLASNVVFLALLGLYIALFAGGPAYNTFVGLRFQIVAQKVVVYVAILNVTFQAWAVTRGFKPHHLH
jgi:hypothetical protein